MVCKNCHSHRVRRIKREGFLRARLAPIFGFYPWRCSRCGMVKLLRARGVKKRVQDAGDAHNLVGVHPTDQPYR